MAVPPPGLPGRGRGVALGWRCALPRPREPRGLQVVPGAEGIAPVLSRVGSLVCSCAIPSAGVSSPTLSVSAVTCVPPLSRCCSLSPLPGRVREAQVLPQSLSPGCSAVPGRRTLCLPPPPISKAHCLPAPDLASNVTFSVKSTLATLLKNAGTHQLPLFPSLFFRTL